MSSSDQVPARGLGHRPALRRDQLRNDSWIIPTLFSVGAFALAVAIARVDAVNDAIGGFGYRGDHGSAQTMLATISTAMLAFIGVVFSITIVALQLASGQLSPRVMRMFQRDRATQVVLGIFLATFVFSLSAMAELGESNVSAAPLMVGISGLLVFASLAAFVFFVHHITVNIRASFVIEHIAVETRRTIDDLYPISEPQRVGVPDAVGKGRAVLAAPRPGVIAAVDFDRLADLATHSDAVVFFLHPVGAHVAEGDPLLEVRGATPIDVDQVLRCVDLAVARTMYQDVEFGLRQLVDIGERALSPAINDPTTAVQVLDRLGDLIRRVGLRPDPPAAVVDGAGQVRVVYPVPAWEALIDLAFEELRWFGRESLQISRRLLSIIQSLEREVAPDRRTVLADFRTRLEEGVRQAFPPSMLTLAMTPDRLGIGG